ncbi:hypothetical protein CYMTET_10796 [Cymbomonas tetramitiformis]|uniref:Histidine phosphatase family protein n=1 Tax=Cymbomonas tetramitiformis TaxID=36881 RepID=A0AAE0GNP9_9CHLO|nr:hypothetical protein CYMTET_10796 [Cymbomonas tetramitiformis]
MKRMWFVRHGEASHNPFIVQGKKENDAELLKKGRSILDPKLTDTGKQQAQGLRAQLEAEKRTFDVVVTTPMSRALETAHIAFSGIAGGFIVTPEETETAKPELGAPQKGRSLAEIRSELLFTADWDFSPTVEGANWNLRVDDGVGGFVHPQPVEERLETFKIWLRSLPYEKIVVVGHSGVFDKLLGRNMSNCEIISMEI